MSIEHLEPHTRIKLAQAQVAARAVGLFVPLGLIAVSVVLMFIWLPRIPRPMATHWNGAGVADGFDSPWVSIVMFPIVGLLLTSMYFLHHLDKLQAMQKPGAPVWGSINRLIPAMVLGSVVLIFVTEVGTTLPQLDLADASTMPSILPVMIGGFVAAAVAGTMGFLVQPKLRIEAEVKADAGEPLDLSATERAVWLGASTASTAFYWVMGITTAMMLGMTIMMIAVEPVIWPAIIIMIASLVLVVVLGLMCARFTVRIDAEGLTARSIIGWPTIRVPAADVERVDVGEISPMGEFGGWGIRFVGGGAMGIVLRTGEGIRIARKSGKHLTVTLDDADTAASVLMTVAGRSGHTSDMGPGPHAETEGNAS